MNNQELINTSFKTPPHSIEAEQAVLGGLMLSNDAWDTVADRICEEDFYRRDHRLIFRAIADLANQDKPRDVVTLSEWLSQRGELDDVGGMVYVGTLAKDTPSAANIKAYANIVKEKSLLRKLIQVNEEFTGLCYQPEEQSIDQIIDSHESVLMSLRETKDIRGPVLAKHKLKTVVDNLDIRFNAGGGITGISTGYDKIDDMLLGLQPCDLILVAARPSMGKTSLAMNITEHACVRHKIPSAIFSLEMSATQLLDRATCSLGRIDFSNFRRGNIGDSDWPKVTSAVALLNEAPLYIDDSSSIKIAQIRARARRLKKLHNIGLMVVDYIQLIDPTNAKADPVNQIAEFSRGLKQIAKELNIPVIALSQLNRSLEQRVNKRPILADLRSSGALEQDADVVMFIYRDEVYNEHTDMKGVAEIIIAKQRNGPTGTVLLTSCLNIMRFENYTPEYKTFKEYSGGT